MKELLKTRKSEQRQAYTGEKNQHLKKVNIMRWVSSPKLTPNSQTLFKKPEDEHWETTATGRSESLQFVIQTD